MNRLRYILQISCLLLLLETTLCAKPLLHYGSILNFFEQPAQNKKLLTIIKKLQEGDTKNAVTDLYKFIDLAKSSNNVQGLTDGYLTLADVLRDNGDFIKSTEILKKALSLSKNNLDKLQFIYFKIGGNFQRDNRVDSAKINYLRALQISNSIQNNDELRAKINANLSGIYYLEANYPKAIEHSKIAAGYQKKIGNKEIEAGILNNLGGIYYMQGNYKEALQIFQEALSIVGYGQDDLQKKTRNSSYINLAYAYSGLGNYEKAFEYQDKYFSLNDSLQQELKYKEIAEIESRYNLANKEKLAEIEKTKRLKTEFLAVSLSVMLLVLLIAIYTLYKIFKLNKKNYILETQQKQLLHENNIKQLKSDSQTKILIATLDGRLEERKKIAQTLHDNVSALLSAANLHLYASTKKIKGEIPVEIEKSQVIISEASDKIRDLSHNLVSSVLLKFGLKMAVQDLCLKSSNSALKIEYDIEELGRFNQDFELKIFNIISELINNMMKHSKASMGVVYIKKQQELLKIAVSDNGIGFCLTLIQDKNGLGISQIEAQIVALKGNFKIKKLKPGTFIEIEVPFV